MAEVVTGEAVVLDLAVARFPVRILAEMIDIAVELIAIFLVGGSIAQASGHLNPASAAALSIVSYVLIIIAYPVTFETLSRGRTLGKLALGIRVVSDDGGPERFRQALIRALAGTFIEIWPPISLIGMPIGLTSSMVSAKGKRLGDLFAGTFVVQERTPRRPELPALYTYIPPPLLDWAHHVELSGLPEHTAAAASSYLRRYPELRREARLSIGMALTSEVFANVSPPPPAAVPADIYLGAILTIRRTRDLAKLAAAPQAAPDAGPGHTVYAPVTQTAGTDTASTDTADTDTAGTEMPAGQARAGAEGPAQPPEDYGFAKPW